MKTLKTAVAAGLLAAVSAYGVTAEVYECAGKNGGRVYTQNPAGNCRKADIGRAAVYSSVPPSAGATAARQDAEPQAQPGSGAEGEEVRAARRQLAQAEQALEEGRKVRYGNERNYVRYQERIAGLERAVEEARRQLEAAQGQHRRQQAD